MAALPTRAWLSPTRVGWATLIPILTALLVGCSGGTTPGTPEALPPSTTPAVYTAQPGAAVQQTPTQQAGVNDDPSAPPPDTAAPAGPATDSPTTDSPAVVSPTDPPPPTTTDAPPPASGPLPPQSSYMQSLCQGYRETVQQEGVEGTIHQVETTNPMWSLLAPNDRAITLEAIRMAGRGCR